MSLCSDIKAIGGRLRGPISQAVPGPSQTRPTFMTQNISKKLVLYEKLRPPCHHVISTLPQKESEKYGGKLKELFNKIIFFNFKF